MFTLALKNILYYKSRSITTFILTLLSTLLFIVYVSMMDGSHNSMLKNSLKIYTSAIQVYKIGYRDEGGYDYFLEDVQKLKNKIITIQGVKDIAARYETFGLLSYKNNSSASLIVGIEPEAEVKISELKSALIKGEYLSDESGKCAYMGVDLVKKLSLKLGDEFSFIGSDSEGGFAADIFKLCGVFKTGMGEFDGGATFISKKYLDTLLYSQNKASYIVVNVDKLEDVDPINQEIEKRLSDKTLESVTWKTLMKTMVEAMEVDSIFGYISLALFMIVIFFVIMIYGFINVSARIKEIGVLRSIGLSRKKVFQLLWYEILILTALALLIAVPIGAYICYYYSVHPIVIEGIAEMYKDYGVISDEIPFDFNLFTIAWNTVVIFILNCLSILYPYIYVNLFTPIEASHHV
ncbi:FtsX-like permease family protein [Sulfurimonas sp. C5]|uniref:ABC transporter permease n=1 Tax=Sulfurimonas sp. C5 TaxID=3036947 RepID=UPI002455219F|nr:FtsX-like permease family protein [Sulfurimonas sp. C5]MDH4944489.1 FtsX-like permease family protein [Sulfurimonas sp. C5]